jgi:short-subunit dehydrogenase
MTKITASTCVVTGAASGLGRALAFALAERGARRLFLVDCNESGLAATAEHVRRKGGEVLARVADLGQRESLSPLTDELIQKWGVPDLVINNAGVSLTATLDRLTLDDFEWLMNINFWAVVRSCVAFAKPMCAAGRGHLVNVSSIYGVVGIPGVSAYSASKFAVRGFTEAIAPELARKGVRATVVIPGGIRTDIVRNSRFRGLDGFEVTHDELAGRFDQMARLHPEQAARRISEGILADRRRIVVGNDAKIVDLLQRCLPNAWGRFVLPRLAISKVKV